MGVYLNRTRIKSRIDNYNVDWLLANVGDSIQIIHDISVKAYTLSSTNTPFIFGNTDGYLPTSGHMWITGGDFSQFNVGDTIQVYDYSTSTLEVPNATIVEKLSDTEIRVNNNPIGWTNSTGTSKAISLKTDTRYIGYQWNFIENDEAINYISKVDGSEHYAEVQSIDAANTTTVVNMDYLGATTYRIGDITIKGLGISTAPVYESKFRITQNTKITPFMLANQWDDILNSIKPDYFENLNCLKSVFKFYARERFNNPNNVQVTEFDETLGNTGYFNENFNARETNYSISNYEIQDNSGVSSTISPAMIIDKSNAFTFEINNATDSPFIDGETILELNFAKAPNFETEYQNNSRDLKHNFVWETALLTVAATPTAINGDNYSDTTLRSLKNLKATFNSSSKITITGSVQLHVDAQEVFNESDEPRYMFWVSVKDSDKVGPQSDAVALLIDSSPFYYQIDFPNLLQFETKIIPHDVENYTDIFVLRDVFTEDELVGYSEIEIVEDEKHLTDSKSFLRFTGKVIALNTVTNDEFTLETNTINVANTPVVSGFQYFNIEQQRPFHIPSTEIRKSIKAWFDTTTSKYHFAYPFMNRWEYWEKLQGVNNFFFDTSEIKNGENHDWRHYTNGNWKLAYVTEIAMKVNGVPSIYKSVLNYDCYDRNLSSEYTNATIKTYDPDTLTELTGSGKKYILGYKNTLVEASFSNNFTTFNTNDTVVIGLEVFEEGGINGKRRMSSKYVSDSDTWFIPLTGETKVNNTNPVLDVLESTVLIDFTKLNLNKRKYKLTARLYGNNVLSEFNTDPYPALKYAANYLASQDVYLIKENPVTEIPDVVEEKQLDCGSDLVWNVLADDNSSDALKNDKNSFLWYFDKDAVSSAELFLVSSNGINKPLTGANGFGTPFDYGFYENNQNEKLVGYLINWKNVLDELGECVYKVKCVYTTNFGEGGTLYSDNYCLKQYTNHRAENTVVVEYYLNGILGLNNDDKKVKDLGTLNWYNQHRFEGIFYYTGSTYKIDEIVYQTGEIRTVEDEQTPEYMLSLKPLASFKIDTLRTDILQADEILITDYNSKNIEKYFKKAVKKVSEFTPKFVPYRTKLASVEIKFKQAFNNLRKFIS